MAQKKLTKLELKQFTGTEYYYRHSLAPRVLLTNGAKYVAEVAGAYWLIDKIAFAQAHKTIAAEEFQVWHLTVRPNHTATLTCEDGNDHEVFNKWITYTDFPLEEITFYFTGNVIMLPGEY